MKADLPLLTLPCSCSLQALCPRESWWADDPPKEYAESWVLTGNFSTVTKEWHLAWLDWLSMARGLHSLYWQVRVCPPWWLEQLGGRLDMIRAKDWRTCRGLNSVSLALQYLITSSGNIVEYLVSFSAVVRLL